MTLIMFVVIQGRKGAASFSSNEVMAGKSTAIKIPSAGEVSELPFSTAVLLDKLP